MNLENITEGQIIKNYKELCLLLDIEVSAGNTKKAQLKEFERYFKYSKQGNKFIIEEIYSEPLEKEDKRKDSLYGQYIEKLILDLLVQQKENNNNNKTVNFGTYKLMETLSMINKNYSYCVDRKSQLSNFLNMDREYIKDFYNISYSKLVKSIESALKRLENKMLIFWSKVITLAVSDDIIESGQIIHTVESHMIADEKITEFIIHIEKSVAKEMGYNTRREIALHEKWHEFNKRVMIILKEQLGDDLLYYYRSYKISFNTFIVEEQERLKLLLEAEERTKNKNELNNTIVDNYKLSNKTRYDSHVEEMSKKYWGRPKYYSERIKISKEYVENNDTLVDTLINNKAKNISNDMTDKQRKDREQTQKELNELFGELE